MLSTKAGCGCEPKKRRKGTFCRMCCKVYPRCCGWMTARGQCANGQGSFRRAGASPVPAAWSWARAWTPIQRRTGIMMVPATSRCYRIVNEDYLFTSAYLSEHPSLSLPNRTSLLGLSFNIAKLTRQHGTASPGVMHSLSIEDRSQSPSRTGYMFLMTSHTDHPTWALGEVDIESRRRLKTVPGSI